MYDQLRINKIETSTNSSRKVIGFAAVQLDCGLAFSIRKHRGRRRWQQKGNVRQIRKDDKGTV